ncbi:erythrocyte membrane protein 1, EMP1 [Plasmodium reichenowi]|uniref:Erythrocyte membrane protein 1, EMP1 n=1 Tax=Plasmodium reichenowi TaxID=5854 RepID=A0A060RQX8_PLARE|nr:erythrocyte membrane protein 1, EMP1 [Plasmodium reichenowi]
MAPTSDGRSAKEVLDEFGKQVHEEVKKEADTYRNKLKGTLSHAKFEGQEIRITDPCLLDYERHTNVTDGYGKEYPCANRSSYRFSDKQGAECNRSKIENNNGKEGGACAPYRRLHLCDYNLENINDFNNINNDTLLVDICLAALHEGESITHDHDRYKEKYRDSQLCTVLARSFADIGDIVRGRDLYLGNPQESAQRKKLEQNLKTIFGNIYKELTANEKESEEIKARYRDEKGKNYYKLREDWWNANRETVWEAITCNAHGSQYFRGTCGSGETKTPNQCRCNGANAKQVPTYFDYVPQYLRWFEEWAEDFCRKKGKFVDIVKTNCRGKYDNKDRYCSRNGYDCEKTVRARGKLRMGKGCTGCLYACNPYVDWIDNQRKQFLKQKEKYGEEITRGGRNSNDNGYENFFYKKLKEQKYGTVEKFLEKLSAEKACTDVNDNQGGTISFEKVNSGSGATDTSVTNDANQGTFYRSRYCQPCPLCGVKKENNGGSGNKWDEKNDASECNHIKLYKPKDEGKGTKIEILKSGEGKKDIEKKLKDFCVQTSGPSGTYSRASGGAAGRGNSDSQELYQEWKCYQMGELTIEGDEDDDDDDDVNGAGGLCILPNKNHESANISSNEPKEFQKTFHNFFYYWVAHMLKDSIYWRTKKLSTCLENGTKKCGKNCKDDCGCFAKWVKQKQNEWDKIEKQFKTQDGFDNEGPNGIFGGGGLGMNYDYVLKNILEQEFLKDESTVDSEENSAEDKQNSLDSEELKHLKEIKKILDEEEKAAPGGGGIGVAVAGKKKTIMDRLIEHEEDEAEECLEIHDEDEEGIGSDGECDEEHKEVHIMRPNPCGDKSSRSRYPVLANKAAQQFQRKARQELRSRAGGRKALRADASKGEYKRGGKGSDLKKDICSINETYSNAGNDKSTNPCGGKAPDRFYIEKEWKSGKDVSEKHKDVCMPRRREHICTANVEYLSRPKGGNFENVGKDKATHSLLGDVLIAAKKEGEDIKNNYKVTNKNEDKCRAMKSSFADIGDIIRGKDMWDRNSEANTLQGDLVKIFAKIKDGLPKEIKDKYNDDEKHTKLRADWWEANRHQVWKAMKCTTKSDKNIKCGTTPYDDYIPQRLRWMTEWAEWFCKAQNKYYGELLTQCGKCTGKIKGGDECYRETEECNDCEKACGEYTGKIQNWKRQWSQIPMKYTSLYLQAQTQFKNNRPSAYLEDDPDYQRVVNFLAELIRQSGRGKDAASRGKRHATVSPNTPYATAAGYIHQELGKNVGCNIQTQFCEKQNAVKPSSGGGEEEKDKYVFKDTPHDHDTACSCGSRTPPKKPEVPPIKVPEVPKTVTPLDPVCKIVQKTLGTPHSDGYVTGCAQKYKFPQSLGWTCVGGSGKGSEGSVCIPPRRRRLYTKKLETLDVSSQGSEGKGSASNKLREAFIECAAIETFFAWHEYKKEKQKERQEVAEQSGLVQGKTEDTEQEELNGGKIPEEFKRQMFYTLGDYRDILYIGDDRGSGIDDIFKGTDEKETMDKIKKAINKVFENSITSMDKKKPREQERETFWNDYGPAIWEAMLCALTYNTKTKEKNNTVYDTLFENGNPKGDYAYESVFFDGGFDETDGGEKSPDAPPSGKTSLKFFVKRPFFFRWLEEWAEEFCHKYKHKLGIIKKECKTDEGEDKKCSGDGLKCTQTIINGQRYITGLQCPDCAKNCKYYKKWINKKKDEFDKLKLKYTTEITKDRGDNGDNGFYKKLKEECTKGENFLEKLEGPCNKNDNEEDNRPDKVDFKDEKTFKHTEKCDPCSQFKIKCENGDCGDGDKMKECQNKTITATSFEGPTDGNGNINKLEMGTIDHELDVDLKDCSGNGVFKGITKDVWKCGEYCGYVVCKPEKLKGKEVNGQNVNGQKEGEQIIQINALFQRWVHNFLEEYNKIKHKISRCIKNGGTKYVGGCKDKCHCVEKWIKEKEQEWKTLRELYERQYEKKESDDYDVKTFLETVIPESYLVDDEDKIIKISEFDNSEGCSASPNYTVGKEDAITCMIKKLQDKMTSCKEQHGKPQGDCTSPQETTTPTDDNHHDILVSPQEFAPTFCNVPPNACSTDVATNVVNVMEVAKTVQEVANKGMLTRSRGKNGDSGSSKDKSVLVGDITQVKINGHIPSDLAEGKICSIEKKHSNIDTTKAHEACYNKGNRLQIGQEWSPVTDTSYKDVYMPPRRQHFCTSNLEEINVSKVKQNDTNINDTLLVDVLWSAKSEAQNIINKYKENNKSGLTEETDKATVCRAIRRSFADIGDIIRGRDMWDLDAGEQKTQGKLKTVFSTIHNSLDGVKDKYTDTNNYLELRADWWEANRDQVWNAMQCQTSPPITTNCDKEPTPIDDHIPQRLRWMTEWAEWYCKEQSRAYDTLRKACEECKSGICSSEGGGSEHNKELCEKCTTACKAYEEKIKQWETQWTAISTKYKELYEKAKGGTTATTSGTSTNDKDKDVVDFLSKLHKQNSGNSIYESAAGYVHQEAHISECQKQKLFCGEESVTNYAFRKKPHDHVKACECEKNNVPPPPPAQAVEEVVEEVVQVEEPGPGADGGGDTAATTPKEVVPEKKKQTPRRSQSRSRGRRNPESQQPYISKSLFDAMLSNTLAWSIGIGITGLSYWALLKRKPKPPVDLFSVLDVPKGEYEIPTKLSSNRYVPYRSAQYRGKRYIYIEGDSGTDSGYTDHYSDITSSSESEYEELDINDIYIPGSPKYKTLIEVVLEPSKRDTQNDIQNDIPSDTPNTPSDIPNSDTPSNKLTDNEWNQLKKKFISNMLQNEQNTEPNILHDNVDNNTHPTPSHNKLDQKPFIMSIHDRNLYTGEEISYNVNMSTNTTDDPKYISNNVYSGIDLINDSLSGDHDIYDELLKRKKNELFGTHHTKNTSNNSVAKNTNSDPVMNQLDLFHKWLDRHRNMCEKWDKNNKKEELLDKLKEEWENETHSGNIHPSDNKMLNTDVSIQIDMDYPKPINIVDINPDNSSMDKPTMDTMLDDIYYDVNDDDNNQPSVDDIPMDHNKVDVPKKVHVNFIKDTILNDLEKHREPYFYDIYDDDITYFDIDNVKPPMGDIHIKEQTEMNALNNNKTNELLEKEYPISDIWNI